MALEAGVVFIDVLPDFSRFRDQVRREMRRIGVQMQADTNKMSGGFAGVERSASGAADSVGDFGDETRASSKESNFFSQTLMRMAPNIKNYGDQTSAADKDTNSFSQTLKGLAPNFSGVGGAMNATNRAMTFFRNGLKLIKFPAVIVGLNILAGAVSAVGAAAGVAVAGLSPLSGLLAAYPGILAAVQQGMGVVRLATLGLSDAFAAAFGTGEEFRESLEDLPEPARQLALEFRELVPRLERLREIAARGLLTPLRGEMTRLAEIFLPMVQDAVRDTAGVLGELGKEAADLVATGPWQRDFGTVLDNNVVVIENFGRAGLLLANAFRNIVVAAQPLVLWISRVAVDVARAIDTFVQGARDSGALTRFFKVTRDVAEDLGGVLLNLGRTFVNIGKAAFPFGRTMLESIEDITDGWADFTGSVEGQRSLSDYFADARPVMREIGLIIRDLVRGFAELSASADVAHFLSRVRKDLLPIFFQIGKTASQGFADALIDLAKGFGELFAIFATESGFLTAFVKVLATFVNVLADLLRQNPVLAQFVVTLGTLRGVMAAFRFGGFITGIGGVGASLLGARGAAAGASTALGGGGLAGILSRFVGPQGLFLIAAGAAVLLTKELNRQAEVSKRLSNRIREHGTSSEQGAKAVQDYKDSVVNSAASAFAAEDHIKDLSAAHRRQITAITRSSDATRVYEEVTRNASSITATERKEIAFLIGVVVRAKGAVSEHTQQLIKNAVQTGHAEGASRALKDELKGVFGQTQATKEEVKRYGDELFKIPPRRHTKVTADTAQAKSELAAWIEQLRNTKVEISVGAAIEAGVPAGAARAQRGNLHTGGWVMAPGHSPQDVPAVLQAGEFVVNRKQAERFQGLLEVINTGKDKGLDRKDVLGTIKSGIDYHEGGLVGKPQVNFNFAAAQGAIAKAIEMVQAMGGYGGDLVAIGRQLQSRGFLVGEHPAFGGVAPVHTTNSYHYQGRAIDINWPGADERTQLFALWHQLANSLGGSIRELFFNGLGIPVAVPHHEDHAHLAMARGGVIREPVFGLGRSGKTYSFGEKGSERVTPEARSNRVVSKSEDASVFQAAIGRLIRSFDELGSILRTAFRPAPPSRKPLGRESRTIERRFAPWEPPELALDVAWPRPRRQRGVEAKPFVPVASQGRIEPQDLRFRERAPQPTLKGVRISGSLDTPFGPADITGVVIDEFEDEQGFQRRRAKAY